MLAFNERLNATGADMALRFRMAMLSLASLVGMVAILVIVVWQMNSHSVEEREQLIQSQVQSARGLIRAIHEDFLAGRISEPDAKELALRKIAAMKFLADGYIWVTSPNGVALMHPYNKEIVGVSTLHLRDAHGRAFVKDFIRVAMAGGGFVFYDWPRPGGEKPAAKVAYVQYFQPWEWIIGSGLYFDDLERDAVQHIGLGVAWILLVFAISGGFTLWLSRRFMSEFRNDAIVDVLTGLYTRAYLEETGPRMVARAEVAGGPGLAAMFFDIDHFKSVNDTYGHKTGDQVLAQVGSVLKASLRPNELAFRYGGEEMVVLLFASEKDCVGIAQRIRTAISNHTFSARGKTFNVTISAGIAMAAPGESLSELLRRADQCLYVAKETGRDRVVVESELATAA